MRAIVGITLAALIVAACGATPTPPLTPGLRAPAESTGTTAGATPAPAPSGSPSPGRSAAAAGASASADDSTAVGAPSCADSELEVASVAPAAGLGTVSARLMFTNVSSRPCSLRGWPSLVGVLADGRVTAARRSNVPLTLPEGASAPPVGLAPGESAYAAYEGSDNPANDATSCPAYRTLRATPPGGSHPALLSAWNAWLNADLPACAGIEVTEVVSAAYASQLGNGPTAGTAPPALTAVDPSVGVAPSTGLRPGQVVEVRVTGFGVGGKVFLSECASAAAATDLGCGAQLAAQPFLATDEGRSGSATFTVSASAAADPLGQAARLPCEARCVLVASLGDGYPFAVAPIAFGP